ncbi:hypothetical protein [Bacillus sp. UMB0728]|uniref:hypothetical protein n=1 Tax=Bacillus sp. UMB0728 TaxID=2066052 RepID=UPI002152C5AB|nr:hypothetical protein [Bacillus sp. UMB0728]
MQIFDIFVIASSIATLILIGFLFIAKKRMDNNEPVAGWKRKQFLEEQRESTGEPTSKGPKKQIKKPKSDEVLLKDLIGIKDIRYGIFEKARNEYSVIVSSDFVNFDLLNTSERQSIILGYQSLFRVINFPLQILGQAVRQDLRKEEIRFKKNLEKANPQTKDYNNRVISYITKRAVQDFRLTRRVYYVVSYIYEPSKMGKLTAAQKERKIAETLYQQAFIVQKMLARAKIESETLGSLEAIEVLKRAMNRDRMLSNPIENLVEVGKEKITSFITIDPSTLPGYEMLVQDLEEVFEDYEDYIPEEEQEERIS